uniref:Secreted protein n=1 Tax=Thraustotheca clavata TaxID=74557 RepID=A0A0A7CM31_9STRA|nr:secreted protein [Thraustotheca clavata]
MRLHVVDAVVRVLSLVFVGSALASDIQVDLHWQNTTFSEVTTNVNVIMRVVATLAQSSLSALQLISMEPGFLTNDVAISLRIHDENAVIDDLLQLPQFTTTGHFVQIVNASYIPLNRYTECFSILMKISENSDNEVWEKLKPLLLEYSGSRPWLVHSKASEIGVCIHDAAEIYTEELNQLYGTDPINLEIFLKSKWSLVQGVSVYALEAEKNEHNSTLLVDLEPKEKIFNCPFEFCFFLQWSITDQLSVNTIHLLVDSTVITNSTEVIIPGDEWLIYDSTGNGSVGFECILDHTLAGPIVLAWEATFHSKDLNSIVVPMVVPNAWSVEMSSEIGVGWSLVTIKLGQESLGDDDSSHWDEKATDAPWPQIFNEIKDFPVGSTADLKSMITSNDDATWANYFQTHHLLLWLSMPNIIFRWLMLMIRLS